MMTTAEADSAQRLWRRRRASRRTVRFADRIARLLIAAGGVGTIVAVLGVCLFLVWVVLPLFAPGRLEPIGRFELTTHEGSRAPIGIGTDEYGSLVWIVSDDGVLNTYRADNGEVVSQQRPFPGQTLVCWAFGQGGSACAFGLADGTIQLGSVKVLGQFLPEESLPESVRQLQTGQLSVLDGAVVQIAPEGQVRLQRVELELEDPISLGGSKVVLIDRSEQPGGPVVAALSADGMLHVRSVHRRKNLLTGKITADLRGGSTAIEPHPLGIPPQHLLLSGLGDNIYLVWPDGRLLRYNARQASDPALAETVDVLDDPAAVVTAAGFLVGKTTLLIGDSLGRLRAWFPVKPEQAGTIDGVRLVAGHALARGTADVTCLGPSARGRMVAVGYADGAVRLYHVTSERLVGRFLPQPSSEPIARISIAPKDDRLLAFGGDRLAMWSIEAGHPEVTVRSIFAPVWYEGATRPEHVWQSSSGTDDFEPKYGLVPLVFGTLKATVYSMLFGAPIALLAAVYTSEFLHRRWRRQVKPVVEMMASLPSVVLGFVAALVFAPVVANIVPEVLCALVAIPVILLLGGYLWQMLPRAMAGALDRLRLVFVTLMLAAGFSAAAAVGKPVERILFAGDIKAWLSSGEGSGVGGWLFLLLPASALAVAVMMGRWVNPWLRARGNLTSRTAVGLQELAQFAAGVVLALLLAWLVAWGLVALGWDPRGPLLGTYVQRNALVVGFVMGFAIIPIIYTLAEDAFSAVPDDLRAASLGAGATAWQTATRVVVPTAASGLFSALMIGLGRAVGETMIVLMAAGNTPLIDWNPFNGFRTLSANIAVELPEAVQNSTHYRMLFLCALCLFVLTFAINTVAEVVRLRFRKKAVQL